jgi:hypothetical protein
VAEALRQEPGVEVEMIDGNRGEFTVLVDGQTVAKKGWIFMPSPEKIRKAVRATVPAAHA